MAQQRQTCGDVLPTDLDSPQVVVISHPQYFEDIVSLKYIGSFLVSIITDFESNNHNPKVFHSFDSLVSPKENVSFLKFSNSFNILSSSYKYEIQTNEIDDTNRFVSTSDPFLSPSLEYNHSTLLIV